MLFDCKYSEKYFYTLKEIADLEYQGSPFSDDDEMSFGIYLNDFLGGIPKENITGIKRDEWVAEGSPVKYGLLHKVWMYILAKHENEFIGWGDIENPTLTEARANETIQTFFRNITYRMAETYPRYAQLLKVYTDEKDNLMADIKSTTRFNDTPQLADSYADDRHATNFTEYNNQYASKIARIDEIDRLYRNLMGEWVDEFTKFFVE